ncbi:MAG: 30S ribosomal protein S9 [Acidilobaceae archaeon]|nr:30S ribosomal protein S9 [Acidilobaceae archaeon]MCX8165809.1 30S ribosomal protein S9 [Acidilobaceae archaeon]MDW7974234.1 30S ribosomal protein S9 [Sulfolobales archaeon]
MITATGKRKTAVAVATVRRGSGKVLVNGVPVELHPVEVARLKIMEPLLLVGSEIRNLVDIDVKVKGGGFMGQAEAARIAIARGLVEFFGCEDESEECKSLREIGLSIRRLFLEYDRSMLSGDPRRTEPEKPLMYSARRRRQRSYR